MATVKIDVSALKSYSAFTYCRKLIREGVDPNTRLEIYRDNKKEFDYAIKNIGQGSKLTIKEEPNVHIAKFVEFQMDGAENEKQS